MKNILKKALTMQKACGIINKQSRDSKEKENNKIWGYSSAGRALRYKYAPPKIADSPVCLGFPKIEYRRMTTFPFGGRYGGIAQLGERLNGIQEVSGSIPLISTIKVKDRKTLVIVR